jgi:hypothetical protein
MSAEVERVFSSAKRLVAPDRIRLNDETIEYLELLKYCGAMESSLRITDDVNIDSSDCLIGNCGNYSCFSETVSLALKQLHISQVFLHQKRRSSAMVACRRSKYLDSFSFRSTFRCAGMHFMLLIQRFFKQAISMFCTRWSGFQLHMKASKATSRSSFGKWHSGISTVTQRQISHIVGNF